MSNLNTNVGVDVDVVKEVTAEVEVSAAEVEQHTAVTNGIPPDGKKGEVLTKNSSAPYDASWEKISDVVGGGLSEEEVKEIVTKQTKELQPKVDETLPTNSKEVVGAIKELYEREDKQGLNAEQVREIVQETAVTKETDPTVPDWAKKPQKPEYTYKEIKENPTLVEDIDASIGEDKISLTLILKSKDGEEIATKTIELPMQDLSDYVKNTDYATASKVGLIMPVTTFGTYVNADNGRLSLVCAEKAVIDAKSNRYQPIVPHMLDYAVKVGVTTNTETLTDDEKASACEWLGAVPKWATDGAGYTNVLGLLANGTYTPVRLAYGNPTNSAIACYVGRGAGNNVLDTGTPVNSTDCANKDYVENLPKYFADTITAEQQAEWRGMIGATKLYLHSMTDKNGETITLIDSSSEQKTPLEMVEAFHANNVINRNYKGYSIVRTTLFVAGVTGIQIEYLIYSTVSGISGNSITLDLTDSTDTVTKL